MYCIAISSISPSYFSSQNNSGRLDGFVFALFPFFFVLQYVFCIIYFQSLHINVEVTNV
ncbi:hypothetical protein Hanom_Chr14g01271321 [Helianthus anomalus]